MNTLDKLNRELFSFAAVEDAECSDELLRWQNVASCYASTEGATAVLSDLRNNLSYIYHGALSGRLQLGNPGASERVESIWEKRILQRVHPEDLESKYVQELRFLHFIKHTPRRNRADYYLMSRLRMRDLNGNCCPVLHRMFYSTDLLHGAPRLALCLYNPLVVALSCETQIVDVRNGELIELRNQDDDSILSEREKAVLRLIGQGYQSKSIACALSISIHTVSRHRHNILDKLQVHNSIEACRVAKMLQII